MHWIQSLRPRARQCEFPLTMWKKLLLLLFCFGLFHTTWAQDVAFSSPQKLSNKTPQFKILGKSNEGVIVYKYGKNHRVIEAYNNNLKLRWKRSLLVKQPNSRIKKILLYPDQSLLFYTSQVKGEFLLYGEKLNNKFQGGNNFLLLDTLYTDRYDVASLTKVSASQNQSHIVTHYPVYTATQLNALRLIGTNKNLEILFKENIQLSTEEQVNVREMIVDNSGNVYMLLDNERRKKRNSREEHFTILQYERESGLVRTIDFGFQQPIFKKLDLRVDNVNNTLVTSGFYTDTNGEEARGFFYAVYDLGSKEVIAMEYIRFSARLIFDVTGKDSTKNVSGFYSFEVTDVILRYDGGATVIAESWFTTEENLQVPSFTPAIGPSFRTISVSYYNDIIVLSVLPNGVLDWWSILKKKQVSEDDDGFFSSYAKMISHDKIMFIYNEEIYPKTNVNEYNLNKSGRVNRQFIFNAGDKNVFLVPRLGQQISSTEILIPSYRRNYLSLVKLTY